MKFKSIKDVHVIKVYEGTTELLVPEFKLKRGPSTSKMPVFYNPTMEFNRDISVLVLERVLDYHNIVRPFVVLDGLAGTGARGIRFANELTDTQKRQKLKIIINDWNRLAVEFISHNLQLNKLSAPAPEVIVTNRNFHTLLLDQRYDWIDIDPFGSPVEFIEPAVRALKPQGILAVTATDTAPLCGTYPKTCLRRYGALSYRNASCYELGVRILVAYCVRAGAKYDLALYPILVHSTDHYFRIYLKMSKGAQEADKCISKIGLCTIDNNKDIGPLWLGKLFDFEFLNGIVLEDKKFGTLRRIRKLLSIWKAEANAPLGYYEIDKLSKKLKISPLPLSDVLDSLQSSGYIACRTHFYPLGVKTNADITTIMSILTRLKSDRSNGSNK